MKLTRSFIAAPALMMVMLAATAKLTTSLARPVVTRGGRTINAFANTSARRSTGRRSSQLAFSSSQSQDIVSFERGLCSRQQSALPYLNAPPLKHVSSSSLFSTTSPSTSTTTESKAQADQEDGASGDGNASSGVKGISWLRQIVVETLNELYDPADVARGAVRAKFEKGNKKNKKKKNKKGGDAAAEEPATDEAPAGPTKEEIDAMVEEAATQASTHFALKDTMVTAATKSEFGDYQVNAAMGLAKNLGMNPRECATQIVESLKSKLDGIMEEPEIAGPGFINLKFTQSYLSSTISKMADDVDGRLAVPKTG
jgi:hypothetical protein